MPCSLPLLPYTKSTAVLLDPGWPQYITPLAVEYYLNLLPGFVAAGGVGMDTACGGGQVFPLDSKAIVNPSAFLLMSEFMDVYAQSEVDPTNEQSDETGFSTGSRCHPPAHQGSANMLFADGHAGPLSHYSDGQMTYWYDKLANWSLSAPP